jgi:L,D-transpeptidase-like protein
MQRLTWTGIAMHSGSLPGYPASHGCIRLPFDFSQLLFSETSKGGTVVVGDGKTPVPYLASNPGLMLAPKDFTPEMLRPLADNDYDWKPERTTSGPITTVVSAADSGSTRSLQTRSTIPSNRALLSSLQINPSFGAVAMPRFSRAEGLLLG